MITKADVPKAEAVARKQRLAHSKNLRRNESIKIPRRSEEIARRALDLAVNDPVKFDSILDNPELLALFTCGALYFAPEKFP